MIEPAARSSTYTAPVNSARPRGAHQFEVQSPKLGRRLRFFDRLALDQWVLLEADPGVTAFCERPVYLEGEGGLYLVDFWVERRRGEELVVIERSKQSATLRRARTESLPGDTRLRRISIADLVAQSTWIANWRRMLPLIVAYRPWMEARLVQDVLRLCKQGRTLADIERALVPVDAMLSRTATFVGLASGRLRAPALHTAALSWQTVFHRA